MLIKFCVFLEFCVFHECLPSFVLYSRSDTVKVHLQYGKRYTLLLFPQEGTVCANNFNDMAAKQLCQELGYRDAESWSTGSKWVIQENYEIFIYEVVCESEHKDCVYRSISNTTNKCNSETQVFLTCKSNNGKVSICQVNSIYFIKLFSTGAFSLQVQIQLI